MLGAPRAAGRTRSSRASACSTPGWEAVEHEETCVSFRRADAPGEVEAYVATRRMARPRGRLCHPVPRRRPRRAASRATTSTSSASRPPSSSACSPTASRAPTASASPAMSGVRPLARSDRVRSVDRSARLRRSFGSARRARSRARSEQCRGHRPAPRNRGVGDCSKPVTARSCSRAKLRDACTRPASNRVAGEVARQLEQMPVALDTCPSETVPGRDGRRSRAGG